MKVKRLLFLILFGSFSVLSQENECVTVVDKSPENSLLFDDSNPLSFVRVVDQSRFQLEPMSRKTFEQVDRLANNRNFSFRLGPQSDLPIQTVDGEDSLLVINGILHYCYLAADTFYYDLSNISRLIIEEVYLDEKQKYEIATIRFAKQYSGSDQYFITASLDYQAFLNYQGYHIDLEQNWNDVFSTSVGDALKLIKSIALSDQNKKPGEKRNTRIKVLECAGVHDYMGDEPPNLTYRANSSNLKYNSSFNCPNLYTLKHELTADQFVYVMRLGDLRPSFIECGDTMVGDKHYFTYPEYYWVMKDSLHTVFTYKAKNLSEEKLELESISFIGEIDSQPTLLVRLIVNDLNNISPKNELDIFLEQSMSSAVLPYMNSVNYPDMLNKALQKNAKTFNSSNESEWNQLKNEVFMN